MYDLPYHKENDPEVVREFIRRYPLATLIGCDAEQFPVATQIPVFIEEVDGREVLRGHFMRKTAHHKAFAQNSNALVIFTGPNCYVSGTWYSNPSTASTWNYMSVHIRGTLRFLDDDGLIDVLRKTTLHFEDGNTASATIFDNLPFDYTSKLLPAIVGFEVEIEKLDTVFKLSQDRDEESYQNIIRELRKRGGDAEVIAEEMERRQSTVFEANKIKHSTN